MMSRNLRQALVIGGVALGCATVGVVAGSDAAGHINGFYTTPKLPRYDSPVVVADSQGWDGTTSATYAAAPVYDRLPPPSTGRDELALYDEQVSPPIEIDPPVRVHRASVMRVEPDPLPPAREVRADDAEDGLVAPPADDGTPLKD